ncbi:hypothetical protein LCGC14_3066840 [marine sediment metagenome]|uniref:site-specific DNA-methyltransferase (adenine-specific) n=1 Tax=marine sediment metagenome TaxID=412755 RepID=A0A0F8WHW7_9ZZZZ
MTTEALIGALEATKSDSVAAPFVKWAGGKRGIIGELVSRLPESFKDYWEPFAGGAALFFELAGLIRRAHLSDNNFDLVVTYNAIKRDPDSLIRRLKEHAQKHDSDYYYMIRAQHELQSPVEIAARLIYLNKTCYNGLYRVNRRGEFNVPMGSYKNPDSVTEQNIRACSKALADASIECRQFDTVSPQAGDFVYFDPPYHATVDTSFTNYTKLDFTEQDQVRLRDFALALGKRKVKVMLSNSDTPFIRDLYKTKAFTTATIQAPRMINCKSTKRGTVNEVLITNY